MSLKAKIEVTLHPFVGKDNTEQLRDELKEALEKTLAEVIEEELEKNKDWNERRFELICKHYANE